MSNNVEVGFSGNINTMVGIALVTAAIALALAVWDLSRINDLEAFVAPLWAGVFTWFRGRDDARDNG